MHTQKGFSLIELLTIVAIIGILASTALYAYQVYLARSQVSEAMQLAGGLRTTVVASLSNNICGGETSTGTYGSATVGGTAPNCTISYIFSDTNVAPPLKSKVLVLDVAPNGTFTRNPTTNISSIYLPSSID